MLPVHHPFRTEDGSGVKMMIKSLEAVFLPPLADAVVTAWLSTCVWCQAQSGCLGWLRPFLSARGKGFL